MSFIIHISGLLNEEKVDIENEKADIESVFSEKSSNFSVKPTVHIHREAEIYSFFSYFGFKK
ncbi:hypothetical protein K350107B32_07940 [Agathobaculum butyriciproducens]